MWCDNCLLIFPLRSGAIALAAFIAAYSLAGGIFLFQLYQFFFYVWDGLDGQIYGGIAMAIMSVAIITAVALSTQSFMLSRLCFILWPLMVLVSVVRGALMLYSLNHFQDRFVWQCNNGGFAYNSTTAAYPGISLPQTSTAKTIPGAFCAYGFSTVYTGFTLALIIDAICQTYLGFCTWRFVSRMRHYVIAMAKGDGQRALDTPTGAS